MAEEYIERVWAMKAKLKALADPETGAPDWQDDTPKDPNPLYTLVLGDTVTTCYGGCHIEVVDNDDSENCTTFNFEIGLGPVNAQKLIDFLNTLGEEPDDG